MIHRVPMGDVASLPVVLRTDEAASLLGVSVDHLWALARGGQAPVEPLRLGRTYRWPTAKILSLLGLCAEGAVASPGSQGTSVEEATGTRIPDLECPTERDEDRVAVPGLRQDSHRLGSSRRSCGP